MLVEMQIQTLRAFEKRRIIKVKDFIFIFYLLVGKDSYHSIQVRALRSTFTTLC